MGRCQPPSKTPFAITSKIDHIRLQPSLLLSAGLLAGHTVPSCCSGMKGLCLDATAWLACAARFVVKKISRPCRPPARGGSSALHLGHPLPAKGSALQLGGMIGSDCTPRRCPDEIRPALNRAQREVDRGSVALVNVKTDDRARAATVTFAQYAT